MPNQHKYDRDEDNHIKEHDEEDWTKECTPEDSNMGQKTTAKEECYGQIEPQ